MNLPYFKPSFHIIQTLRSLRRRHAFVTNDDTGTGGRAGRKTRKSPRTSSGAASTRQGPDRRKPPGPHATHTSRRAKPTPNSSRTATRCRFSSPFSTTPLLLLVALSSPGKPTNLTSVCPSNQGPETKPQSRKDSEYAHRLSVMGRERRKRS